MRQLEQPVQVVRVRWKGRLAFRKDGLERLFKRQMAQEDHIDIAAIVQQRFGRFDIISGRLEPVQRSLFHRSIMDTPGKAVKLIDVAGNPPAQRAPVQGGCHASLAIFDHAKGSQYPE